MKFSLYLFCMSSFFACRKSDNAKLPDLIRAPIPLLTKDASADLSISGQDPNNFNGKIIVDLYYKNDVKPSKFDLVVIKNGDNSNVKTVKENITDYPSTVDVTGSQLVSLFGSPIVVGDNFDFGVNATMPNSQKFTAFLPVGTAYGPNIFNLPGSSPIVRYSALCPFDLNSLVGTATVSDPDFWGADYPVTVTLAGNILSIDGWVQQPGAVVNVTVDVASLTATIPHQVYYPTLPTTPYHNPYVEGTGVIDACNNTLTMTLDNGVDEGTFGSYTMTLHK